jgi:GH15 family glucan-1,4-alpha-glucosidase
MLLPLVGFIRADDPRMISTVAAIQERLTTDGLVHRYLAEDGLPGEEGAFTICSFWLVDDLALQGRVDEAQALFERVCSLANDVGLFAEQIDPRNREQLGNFPQAFTHVALINGALHLQRPRNSR